MIARFLAFLARLFHRGPPPKPPIITPPPKVTQPPVPEPTHDPLGPHRRRRVFMEWGAPW